MRLFIRITVVVIRFRLVYMKIKYIFGKISLNLNSINKLFMKHSSKLYNLKLVNIFFKSGMIEAWGREFGDLKN